MCVNHVMSAECGGTQDTHTIENIHVVYGFITLKSLTDKEHAEHSHLQRDT